MDWGTVVPAAITGVVGLAGIGGALLSARMTGKSDAENLRTSISAEDRRARLAEKRRIYANCLATLTIAATARAEAHDRQGAAAALVAAANAAFEVKLIAPRTVCGFTDPAMSRLANSEFGKADNRSADAIAELAHAMRVDLGEPMV